MQVEKLSDRVRPPTPRLATTVQALDLPALQRRYAKDKFLQIANVVEPDTLLAWMDPLEQSLSEAAEEIQTPHRVENGRLLGGAHYLRLDPGHPMANTAIAQRQKQVLDESGLWDVGTTLASALSSIVGSILGSTVSYDRVYLLGYRSDHYLSVHDDKQTGNRINVQLPITRGCHTGLRVLGQNHLLETHRDAAGTLRFLGPGIWHEVPPVIGEDNALRLNITLRYRMEK